MKILILRFSSIGDIVLTTPVIRCLKKQANAEVHFLTKASFSSVLEANPYIDKLFCFKKTVAEVLPELKKENYDFVCDLHHNMRSTQIKWSLACPSKSFDKLNFEKWLLVNFGINRMPEIHIVARYLETVKHLGVENDGAGLDFFIPPEKEINLKQDFSALANTQFVCFAIGATHQTKRLPFEKMLEICQKTTLTLVLLGGKTEAEDGAKLAEMSENASVFNLCGKLDLYGSASMIRQSEAVITHDTGMMHIAAAFRKRIISVWGNTIPAFGMYPYYPQGEDLNTTVEVKGLSCRPCSKIGHAKCPKGHFNCMEKIEINDILVNISRN